MNYDVMYQHETHAEVLGRCFEWRQHGPYQHRFVARIVCWWQRNVQAMMDDDCNGFLAIRARPYIIEVGALPKARTLEEL